MIAYVESKQIELVSDNDATPEDNDLGPGSDWYEANPEESQKYLDEFDKTWGFFGVRATATIRISEDDHPNGYVTRFTIRTAGVWGVAVAFGEEENGTIQEYEDDEMFALNEMLEALDVQTNTISNERAYELASLWHGGQSSPLYSLTSTHKVHGQAHKTKLIREINREIRNITGRDEQDETSSDDGANLTELNELLDWVNVQ